MNSCSPSTVRLYVSVLGNLSARSTSSCLSAIGANSGLVVASLAAVPLESLLGKVLAFADEAGAQLWDESVAAPSLKARPRAELANLASRR